MNVIIACGKKKQTTPSMAYLLYTGSYFKLTLQCATRWTSLDNLYIFSSKYGVIHSRSIIDPYEQKLHQIGAVTLNQVRKQMSDIDGPVCYLGGSGYLRMLRQIRDDVIAPLQDNLTFPRNRLGGQMQQLKQWSINNENYPHVLV